MNIFSGFVTALAISLLFGASLWVVLEEGTNGIQITDDIGFLE